MKISYAIHLTVGLFIVLAFAALTTIALKVSGLSLDTNKRSYTIYAHFNNISGLSERARVSISGVTIGRVVAIGYDEEELAALVTMQIDDRFGFINTDASASILTSGLLGEKYIGVELGADDSVLTDGGYIDYTQSAVVLEDLIGKFLLDQGKE